MYKSFIRIKGYPLSAISVFLMLLPFFVTPTTEIPVRWVVFFALPFFLFLFVVCDVAYRATQEITLPRVKASRMPSPLYPDALAVLIVEKSNLFGHESVVSVYLKEDDFEILIGVGYVSTVQQDGHIQIIVTSAIEEAQNGNWEKIRNNDGGILSKLLIRPSIPRIIQNIGV